MIRTRMSAANELAEAPLTPLTKEDLDLSICKVLWLSVLIQTAYDLKSVSAEIKMEAVFWIASEDFMVVCDIVGIDYRKILKFFDEVKDNKYFSFNLSTIRRGDHERISRRMRRSNRQVSHIYEEAA